MPEAAKSGWILIEERSFWLNLILKNESFVYASILKLSSFPANLTSGNVLPP